ncbi:MAG: BON domain-containing protein [Candidatus Rokuibacteriota bacterium]
MRNEFKIGVALVTAVLFAWPLSAGAADKAGKTESTMDRMENNAKETTQEVKGAVSDSWLTSKAKIALFADDRVKGKDVRVETVNGEVFLRGKVDSEDAKTAAAEIAKGLEGVKSVKNDLQVVAPEARKTVTANDKQITKAVETSFNKDPQLKKIDVRTDAGVVVLSGEVPNISVSAKASEMAHRVDGVRSVKNELRVAQAKAN